MSSHVSESREAGRWELGEKVTEAKRWEVALPWFCRCRKQAWAQEVKEDSLGTGKAEKSHCLPWCQSSGSHSGQKPWPRRSDDKYRLLSLNNHREWIQGQSERWRPLLRSLREEMLQLEFQDFRSSEEVWQVPDQLLRVKLALDLGIFQQQQELIAKDGTQFPCQQRGWGWWGPTPWNLILC